jgi:hypothetical protein
LRSRQGATEPLSRRHGFQLDAGDSPQLVDQPLDGDRHGLAREARIKVANIGDGFATMGCKPLRAGWRARKDSNL